MKDLEGKYDPTYTFRSAKIATHYVREYGSKKYLNRDTWKLTDKIEFLKASERHIDSINEGEFLDDESGLPHSWHALCNLVFYVEAEYLENKGEQNATK